VAPREATVSDAALIPSPCTSVCRMDSRTGLCEGCMRTLDEIAQWSTMPSSQKMAVWDALARRRIFWGAAPSENSNGGGQ
jgi:predicted Fe-S protein YdhL (DUF1289 family)